MLRHRRLLNADARRVCGVSLTKRASNPWRDCLGQAADQERQSKNRNPKSDDGVEVAPEAAVLEMKPRVDDAGRASPLWPPEDKPAYDHDECPRSCELDDVRAFVPENPSKTKARVAFDQPSSSFRTFAARPSKVNGLVISETSSSRRPLWTIAFRV